MLDNLDTRRDDDDDYHYCNNDDDCSDDDDDGDIDHRDAWERDINDCDDADGGTAADKYNGAPQRLRICKPPPPPPLLPQTRHCITVVCRHVATQTREKLARMGFVFINVTNRANDPRELGGSLGSVYRCFNPSANLAAAGGVPVPVDVGEGPCSTLSASVEGVWQGLKVIDGVRDHSKFAITNGKGLSRRTASVAGCARRPKRVEGHYNGPGKPLLGYVDARVQIFLPVYLWALRSAALAPHVEVLRHTCMRGNVALVDYTDNCDIQDTRTPLSHAHLLRAYILGEYPACNEIAQA